MLLNNGADIRQDIMTAATSSVKELKYSRSIIKVERWGSSKQITNLLNFINPSA